MKNIYIINNTLYNNGNSNWGGGVLIENRDAEEVVVRNNLCSQNVFSQIQVEVNLKSFTIDHNLIDGYRGYAFETYGNDAVEGNPLFVNAAGADFHLEGNSPAIDKGSSAEAPGDDYEGTARPQGLGYDIGAYEYATGREATTTSSEFTTTALSTTTTVSSELCPAEAIYEEHSEKTEILRDWRDNFLTQTPEGQEIIKLYYQWSPVIVETMEKDEDFKEDVRELLDGVLELVEAESE